MSIQFEVEILLIKALNVINVAFSYRKTEMLKRHDTKFGN